MDLTARKITVTGRVQGVGYRPFVYVTARDLGLKGHVLNGSGKVFIHAEGPAEAIDCLEQALVESAPPLARPCLASSEAVEPAGADDFQILASEEGSESEIHVPPDLFTCDDCLQELTDPAARRHGYPFINCTQCGPRYTLITAMPYDRPNTSMADFPLCDACRAEYESPADRRFHAQPLACADCGPTLEFVPAESAVEEGVGATRDGNSFRASSPAAKPPLRIACALAAISQRSRKSIAAEAAPTPSINGRKALEQALRALNEGAILAIKGVGGYHLVCDAASDAAVQRLRERKHRPHKPLAVMFPLTGEDGLETVREHLDLSDTTAVALTDPARPIVLVPKRADSGLSAALAPGLRELGAFLPYSPLHHQLLAAFGRPVVATSGNISGEPVITANAEAERRLGGVADAFLHHDRPIVRPADDPVVRPIAGRVRPLRLGRGIAPLEVDLPWQVPRPVLATGGHMKDTVALAWDRRVVISPHIGDLDSPRSNDVFTSVINDLQKLYNVNSQAIACDLHPGYASSRWAAAQALPLQRVQHHAAHASALAGEYPEVENWLVFTWDGVGYGGDGTLWGGEALAGGPGRWQRVASFRPFHLVGGDKAGREPWRSAAALLWAEGQEFATATNAKRGCRSGFGRDGFKGSRTSRLKPLLHPRSPQPEELHLARQAWQIRTSTFETTAAGRLFDAAAALVLERHFASFEGQGPMELEQIAEPGHAPLLLPLAEDSDGLLRSDWAPLLEILSDQSSSPPHRAGVFHESLARVIRDQAVALRERHDFDAVGLSGGVFQNRYLTERAAALLQGEGLDVRLHRDIPANDGGLCFGQIVETIFAPNLSLPQEPQIAVGAASAAIIKSPSG